MWLNYGNNPTLAELLAQSSQIHGGGSIPAHLLQRPRTWQDDLKDVVKTISPQIKDYMQRKKSDEIADRYMNMRQPPRAEAIGYEQGAPPTSPFTGGADGLRAYQMLQADYAQQQDDELKRRLTESQIIRNLRERGDGSQRMAVEEDGQTYYVTPNEALRHRNANRKQAKGTDIISKSGLSVEDLDTPNLVKYYRQEGEGDNAKQLPVSAEDAPKYPGQVYANPPGSKTFVPLEQWNAAAESFKRKHGVQSNASTTLDQQALQWAKTHPSDPRAEAILQRLGLQ